MTVITDESLGPIDLEDRLHANPGVPLIKRKQYLEKYCTCLPDPITPLEPHPPGELYFMAKFDPLHAT